jgi:predicted  nucleic acid-binding Zn-ribbon protein
MADPFRPVFEGLKQVADGLILANEGIKKLADADLSARDEHEDLRETVARLESLLIAQSAEIRAQAEQIRELRDRLDGRD